MSVEQSKKTNKFWQFVKSRLVKSKKNDSLGASPLRSNEGFTYTDSKMKANILRRAFKSVFNVDQHTDIPCLKEANVPPMQNITVEVEGVFKLLLQIDPQKAAGPDGISVKLLKDHATYLAPPFDKNIPSIFIHSHHS